MRWNSELDFNRLYNEIIEIQKIGKEVVKANGHDIHFTEAEYMSWEIYKNGKGENKES